MLIFKMGNYGEEKEATAMHCGRMKGPIFIISILPTIHHHLMHHVDGLLSIYYREIANRKCPAIGGPHVKY